MLTKIGLDLGYANITLSDVASGIYREPSVALVDKESRKISVVGNAALMGEDVASGIVLRAGWHSIIHNAGLFKEFPWLAKAVKESKPGFGYRTPFLFQLIVKAYAAFKR